MTICPDTYTPWAWPPPGDQLQCHRELDSEGRHRGEHQAWQYTPARTLTYLGEPKEYPAHRTLWTWSEGGAHGSTPVLERSEPGAGCMKCRRGEHDPAGHALQTCGLCGALHDPLGYFLDGQERLAPEGTCFSCRIWWVRAEHYAGRLPSDKGARAVHPMADSPSFGGTGRLYGWNPGSHGAFGGTRYSVLWSDGTEVGPDDCLWYAGVIPWEWLDAFPPNATVTVGERVKSTTGLGRGRMGGRGGNEWPDFTGHP